MGVDHLTCIVYSSAPAYTGPQIFTLFLLLPSMSTQDNSLGVLWLSCQVAEDLEDGYNSEETCNKFKSCRNDSASCSAWIDTGINLGTVCWQTDPQKRG